MDEENGTQDVNINNNFLNITILPIYNYIMINKDRPLFNLSDFRRSCDQIYIKKNSCPFKQLLAISVFSC